MSVLTRSFAGPARRIAAAGIGIVVLLGLAVGALERVLAKHGVGLSNGNTSNGAGRPVPSAAGGD